MSDKQQPKPPKSVRLTEKHEQWVEQLQKKLKRPKFTDLVLFLIEQEAERQNLK